MPLLLKLQFYQTLLIGTWKLKLDYLSQLRNILNQ